MTLPRPDSLESPCSRRLRLCSEDLEALFDRAAAVAPEECCGILLGVREATGWRVLQTVYCLNAAIDRTRSFAIDPKDLVKAHQVCRGVGLKILGFFHSHPTMGTRPSRRDREEGWPGYIQLILGGGEPWQAEGWILSPQASRPARRVAIERVAA